jgi:uncharacterized protein (DUF302 family)
MYRLIQPYFLSLIFIAALLPASGQADVDSAATNQNATLGINTVVLSDATDVSTAVAEISSKLKEQGFEIPLVLDHLAAAASVGLVQAPNQVIFARPPHYLEKQLLRKGTTIGIDLPLKFQVFEQDGSILLSVNTLGYLIDRHEMRIHDFALKLTDKLIGQFGPSDKEKQGLVTIQSLQSFATTVQTLQDTISTNPDARIPLIVNYGDRPDRSSASNRDKNTSFPTLIVFGNPKVGTPLMQADARIGIDLPLEFLVWKNQHEEVQITYNNPRYIAGRINLQGQNKRLETIATALKNIAMAGAGRSAP